jgi:hypothetical protein
MMPQSPGFSLNFGRSCQAVVGRASTAFYRDIFCEHASEGCVRRRGELLNARKARSER